MSGATGHRRCAGPVRSDLVDDRRRRVADDAAVDSVADGAEVGAGPARRATPRSSTSRSRIRRPSMRRKPLDRMDCSIAKALDIVGDPWTMLILRDALLGVKRFETFSTRLGIPRATLSARLDHLCERGVLEQRPIPGPAGARRVRLDAEGSGVAAGRRHADAMGRPVGARRRPADDDRRHRHRGGRRSGPRRPPQRHPARRPPPPRPRGRVTTGLDRATDAVCPRRLVLNVLPSDVGLAHRARHQRRVVAAEHADDLAVVGVRSSRRASHEPAVEQRRVERAAPT